MAVEQDDADGRGQSRLVLLAVMRDGVDLDGRLTIEIRRAVAQHASPTHVPQLVVQVPELPVTANGKRSERAARDAVNGAPAAHAVALANPGCLDEIARAAAAAERARRTAAERAGAEDGPMVERLRAIWEAVLGVAPLDPEDDFYDLGGSSLDAVRLFQAIHDRLGVDLPLSTLIYARTIATMAAMVESPAGRRAVPVPLLRPGEGGEPLFIVHALWGDVLPLQPLALALRTERPVFGLQARGLDPGQEPQRRVEEMAATYVDSIRTVQRRGPYLLAGYSFGGLVAFEMARRLRAAGDEVAWLGLIDTDVNHHCLRAFPRFRFRVGKALRIARSRLVSAVPADSGASGTPDPPPAMRPLLDASWQAFDAYRPQPYDGRVTLLMAATRATGPDRLCDPLSVWRRVVRGRLEVERVPGDHNEMISEGRVAALADRVSAHL
jgi:acetoacetyl-CoA synthetase